MISKSQQAGRFGKKGKIKISNADKWFSIFIRLRDIVQPSGLCRCITCGKFVYWKDMDCGHFVSRARPATRFTESNCHAQCTHCNRFLHGNEFEYGKAIDSLYGIGTAQKLKNLGAIRGQKVHSKDALEIISDIYRVKSKQLAHEKGVEI